MKAEIKDADMVKTATVNSGGTIYLGRDLSGEDVRVAVERIDKEDEE